ncbi:MAG: ribokinase [Bauldia sp.]|nr:ribokinase [Bauldia sp.]
MPDERAPRVVVLGSVHMDLIATAARLPGRGESVTGGTFAMAPGGKAGNQACQCALAGAETRILTRFGDDAFGRELTSALAARGVDVSLVAVDPEAATGASTVLAGEGDYQSIIAPGAAGRLSTEDIARAAPAIGAADALILQLEIDPAISAEAAAVAAAAGRLVVLNASPAPEGWDALPEALRRSTGMLVVNRVEAGRLLGGAPAAGETHLARLLADRTGVRRVIVTEGSGGVSGCFDDETVRQPAFPAAVVDTVGAGDAFLGTTVVALLEGRAFAEALRRGAAAGCLAVSRGGVYDALPDRAAVDAFLAARA